MADETAHIAEAIDSLVVQRQMESHWQEVADYVPRKAMSQK